MPCKHGLNSNLLFELLAGVKVCANSKYGVEFGILSMCWGNLAFCPVAAFAETA